RERRAGLRHTHYELEHVRNFWPAIDEITEEDDPPTFGMMNGRRAVVCPKLVTEFCQQRMKLVKTTVHVADDVEWPVFVFEIVPKSLSFNHDLIDLVLRRELVDVTKPFALQIANRPEQLLALLA